MAYERQISPTSIDELSSLPALNCNTTLDFVGLTITATPHNEHSDSHNSQGKDSQIMLSVIVMGYRTRIRHLLLLLKLYNS
jgi:hypothetical protein